MTAVCTKEIGFPSSRCLVSFLAASWVGDVVTGSSWCLLGELWRGGSEHQARTSFPELVLGEARQQKRPLIEAWSPNSSLRALQV